MNASNRTELHRLSNSHLDSLEEETIFILREVAAAFERPALLFSGGKDSLVMLKCAEKAFGVGRLPYPLLTTNPWWWGVCTGCCMATVGSRPRSSR